MTNYTLFHSRVSVPKTVCGLVFFWWALTAHGQIEIDSSLDFMIDANSYDGSLFVAEELRESGSEIFLRRAQFELDFDLTRRVSGEVSVEYEEIGDEFSFKDVYLAVEANDFLDIIVGKFKEPAGMEKDRGFKYQYFLERSLATNLYSFPRNTGVRALVDGKGWNMDVAVLRIESEIEGVDDGLAYVARVTANPYRSEDRTRFLHLGAMYSTRDIRERRFDVNEPVLAYSQGNLIHSPNYDIADTVSNTSVEGALTMGKASLQVELFNQKIDTRHIGSFEHGGYYVTGVWTLFGTAREYRKGEVRFPKNIERTLELAARFSNVDTTNFGEGDIADVFTVALSYYPSKKYRFALEYEQADVDRYDGGVLETLDGNSVNARVQANF